MTHAWLTYPASALLALFAAGCEVHTHSHGYYDDDYYYDEDYSGWLSIDWSLDDSLDPDACDHYDAYETELILYEDGHEIEHFSPRCEEFELSIDLHDGEYSLDATLIDGHGDPVTTTLSLDDIDVYEGHETRISLDFPLDSRL